MIEHPRVKSNNSPAKNYVISWNEVTMKIEDLHYNLPTEPFDDTNFDIEQWRRTNPMDYLKALYIVFGADKIVDGVPSELAKAVAFQAVYKVTRQYIPDTLYKYGSLTEDTELNDKKFQTLLNQQIFMADIKDFNDPFDGKAFYYDPEKLKGIDRLAEHNGRFIDDFTQFHKATSLTENGVNCMPMWAHYSNNHRGFCVAYDMKHPDNLSLSACTFPVQYTDQRLDITSFMRDYAQMVANEVDRQEAAGKKQIVIDNLSIIYIAQFLCNIKHISWQYEKEFRCTMGATAKGMPYVTAVPKAIYIGMNCLPNHVERLYSIGQTLRIPVHKMEFEECSENFDLKVTI